MPNKTPEFLCRYIPFEAFVDIVLRDSLTFVSPLLSWEDTYEGYLFRMLKSPDGPATVRKLVEEILGTDDVSVFMTVLKSDLIINSLKFQCWSENINSVPMWSIYSYGNKSIMLKVKYDDLKSLIFRGEPIELFPVTYTDTISARTELQQILFSDNKLFAAGMFQTKRIGFEYEKEHRLCFSTLEEDGQERAHPPRAIKTHIPIQNFISGVLVHPLAPRYYVSIVNTFCQRYNLNFLGQSNLYNLNV